MKLPKTFLPENSLENKIDGLLKSNKSTKNVVKEDYKKRNIKIYSGYYDILLDDDIHVVVKQPKGKKGYLLNTKSRYDFFYPLSGSNTVPAILGNTKAKAYVRSQGMLHDYLNSLKHLNNGKLEWRSDKLTQKLKKNYNAWQSFTKYVMDDNT